MKPGEGQPFEFPDQTVDFAQELIDTPIADLPARVRKLSGDMVANLLIEIVRRFQESASKATAEAEELANLRFHVDRLEKILLELARGNRKT